MRKPNKEERFEMLVETFDIIDNQNYNWFKRLQLKIYFLLKDLSRC